MKIISIFFCCLSMMFVCKAGTLPALEREVSVRANNEPVKEVLSTVAQQAGIQFSYNPAKVPVTKNVSLALLKKPVRLVLNILFKNTVQYKQKGNYIILVAAPPLLIEGPVKKISISGYIHDGNGNKLASASVFDKKNQLAAVSNEYGFFSLQIPANVRPVEVRVLKENYRDTSVVIKTSENSIDIVLVKIPEKAISLPVLEEIEPLKIKPVKTDSIAEVKKDTTEELAQKGKRFLEQLISPKIKANLHNISDTLFTKVQFSFVPYISTNALLSGNTVNDVSFNLLAGYSQGVNTAEFGALVNIDRGNVKYFQAAGLMNVVGGQVKGGQFAGLMNVDRHNVNGAQAAGLINFTLGNVKGIQAAGLLNICNKTEGVQVSGLINLCRYVDGVQATSIVNVAEEVKGWQCAALVNSAWKVKGGQVALVNVSDSCSGVPVGFLSYVHHGYHKIELAGDEVLYTQVAFRTGVLSFHNIFSIGVNPFFSGTTLTGFGYGLGSSLSIGRKWNFGGDIFSQSLVKDLNFKNAPLLTSVFIGFERKVASKFSIAFGPVFRALITYNTSADYLTINNQIAPYTFTDHSFNGGTNVKMWVGGKLGLRFL